MQYEVDYLRMGFAVALPNTTTKNRYLLHTERFSIVCGVVPEAS